MISIDALRQRIDQANAWTDLMQSLNLSSSDPALAQNIDEQTVRYAYIQGSLVSTELRSKLHKYGFPALSDPGASSQKSPLYYHLASGLDQALDITELTRRHGFDWQQPHRILDFGCQDSSVLRFFLEFSQTSKYFAFDESIESTLWGKENFPTATYVDQNHPIDHHSTDQHHFPLLNLPDHSFDLIYSSSNFTSYPENLHFKWLHELNRLLSPEGLLLVSVYGDRLIHQCRDDFSTILPLKFPIQHYEALLDAYREDGYFNYSPYQPEILKAKGLDPQTYGISFISKSYIEQNWTVWFDLLEYLSDSGSRWQDYVVLRKRDVALQSDWETRDRLCQWQGKVTERSKLAARLGKLYVSSTALPASTTEIDPTRFTQIGAGQFLQAEKVAQVEKIQQLTAEIQHLAAEVQQLTAEKLNQENQIQKISTDLENRGAELEATQLELRAAQERVVNLMNSRWRKLGRLLGIAKAVPWENE